MSEGEPLFNLRDVQQLVNAIMDAQSIPFHLFIQGASPTTETAWLEQQFLLPSAKADR